MLTIEMFRTIHRSDNLRVHEATALEDLIVTLDGREMTIEEEEILFVSFDLKKNLRAHWVSLDGSEHWSALIQESDVTIKEHNHG